MSITEIKVTYTHHLRVTQADIDELGHASNYLYLKWMQDAATAHSTQVGWSPQRYRDSGFGWVVRSHQITYFKPAVEEMKVTIKTWVADMKAAASLRRYRFENEKGETLAEAETNWAFIDYRKMKPIRIPKEVSERFEVCES